MIKLKLKKLIVILVSAVVVSISVFAVKAADTPLYDVNLDGKVSILDATEIQKYLVHLTVLDEEQIKTADINGDEKISILDAACIQKYLVGLFPEPEETNTTESEPFSSAATEPMTTEIVTSEPVTTEPVTTEPINLSLSTSSKLMKVGQTFNLIANVNNSSYDDILTWTSTNTKVADIKMQNKTSAQISAKMQGTATIIVKAGNEKTASCKITVSGSVVKCLDVSTWQGKNIDFNKVKSAGYNYVIIRSGYGRETYQKDDCFETNYKKAKSAGLKVGTYWFSYAMSAKEAKIEADACLYCIKGKAFDLPVYYDIEYVPAITELSQTEYTNMATSFCNKIRSAGYKPGIYASASVYGYPLKFDTIKSNGYSVWNAEWSDKYTVNCDIWQYTDKAKVNGISENVDCSYIYNLNIAN